jgi:hypothetical protein
MNEIQEIRKALEKTKSTINATVNATFDRLLLTLEGKEASDMPTEYAYPFTADTNIFIGKKPIAVMFSEERVEADNWRKVFAAIMAKCNGNAQCHDKLMYLRDKVAGKVRVFLSNSPDSMRRPLKIDEDMYAEVCYGTATLLNILRDRILTPAGFDCSGISIVLKEEGYERR